MSRLLHQNQQGQPFQGIQVHGLTQKAPPLVLHDAPSSGGSCLEPHGALSFICSGHVPALPRRIPDDPSLTLPIGLTVRERHKSGQGTAPLPDKVAGKEGLRRVAADRSAGPPLPQDAVHIQLWVSIVQQDAGLQWPQIQQIGPVGANSVRSGSKLRCIKDHRFSQNPGDL